MDKVVCPKPAPEGWRRLVVCADGLALSIRTDGDAYAEHEDGVWVSAEVGVREAIVPEWDAHREPGDYGGPWTVYCRVPLGMVWDVVAAHGGSEDL